MGLEPNKKPIAELQDRLTDAFHTYREEEEKFVERSITYAESRTSKLGALIFDCLLVAGWVVAILWDVPIGRIFDGFQFLPVTIMFYISYFAFLHTSKIIFRPTEEETNDDTSYFALFSACDSRASRGLFSAAFGVANAVAITLYVVLNQTGLDAWRLF